MKLTVRIPGSDRTVETGFWSGLFLAWAMTSKQPKKIEIGKEIGKMKRIEYINVVDMSNWPRGPWNDEPDKIQWQDEASGLPCLIVRGPVGSLCGYVGVAPGHSLYGKDYSSDEMDLDVHGGLTFSGTCMKADPKTYEEFCASIRDLEREARKYPNGDAAERVKDWGPLVGNYDAWVGRRHATSICHVPAPGEPDEVWWFGFDCAHAFDLAPKMLAYGVRAMSGKHGDKYRDIAYVTEECRRLAEQLSRK